MLAGNPGRDMSARYANPLTEPDRHELHYQLLLRLAIRARMTHSLIRRPTAEASYLRTDTRIRILATGYT
jgi:hypothetical protein